MSSLMVTLPPMFPTLESQFAAVRQAPVALASDPLGVALGPHDRRADRSGHLAGTGSSGQRTPYLSAVSDPLTQQRVVTPLSDHRVGDHPLETARFTLSAPLSHWTERAFGHRVRPGAASGDQHGVDGTGVHAGGVCTV